MNGIENIISRITAEAEKKAAEMRGENEKKLSAIKKDSENRVSDIEKEAQRRIDDYKEASLVRSLSACETAKRNIMLAAKSDIIDNTFEKAEKYVGEMKSEDYTALMVKLLVSAASENECKNKKLVLLISVGEKELFKNIVKTASEKALMDISDITETEKLSNGFILKAGDIEINCVPAKLIAARRDEFTEKIIPVLFN